MVDLEVQDIKGKAIFESDIEVLEKFYSFGGKDEVLEFLGKYRFLLPVLLEAPLEIERFFPNDPLMLKVTIDPEARSEDEYELVLMILTRVEPDESVDRLLELDHAWWLSAARRTQGKMFIALE